MQKNTKILIGTIAALIVLIIVGGIYFFMSRNMSNSPSSAQAAQNGNSNASQNQTIATLKPSDIGLQLVLSNDKKKVSFTADKLSGVKTLEWNFSYQADIPQADQTQETVGQKITEEFGSDNPVALNGQSSYSSTPRELGTCSSGTCRYDTGVTSVQLELKVTKDDGSVNKVDDSINL